MKPETILKRAIEKARKNGYESPWKPRYDGVNLWSRMKFPAHFMPIIFSHDFAKKFFGKKEVIDHIGQLDDEFGTGRLDRCPKLPAWEYHLMQMVREKDPVLYLKKFL